MASADQKCQMMKMVTFIMASGGILHQIIRMTLSDEIDDYGENDLWNLCIRHKEAQDCIVRAGNNFELTVQR